MVGYITIPLEYQGKIVLNRTAPAGFRLLAALDRTAIALGVVLELTCGQEGHPVDDPHTLGEAFDLRSHNFTPELKDQIVTRTIQSLSFGGMDNVMAVSGGYATMSFFGWLEHAREANEHFHFQRRKGTRFPITQEVRT